MSGGSRVPWLYRVVRDRTAQTSPLAVILLLGIVVAGTTAVVAFGGVALDETKQQSRLSRAEHTMTLFDSRVAITALGDAGNQEVDLGGTGGGQYVVDPNSGWLRITHENFSDAGNSTVIYNETLGSVDYRDGDTTIAYEGGGVWRTQDNGTTMVSPPEFHYRDATLTLPVVRVTGEGAASGNVAAHVTTVERAHPVYPNDTARYPGIETPYDNPVSNGTVVVTVHSAHYKGWASFFRTRTMGVVSVDDANRTASVELQTLGLVGAFRMPNEDNSLDIGGMAWDHNVSKFAITLANDQHLQNMEWGMYHDGERQDFELHVQADSKCQPNGTYDGTFDLTVYYATEDGKYQGWRAAGIDPNSSDAVSIDCSVDPAKITVNFTSTQPMTYGDIPQQSVGNENKWHFGPEIKDGSAYSSVTLDQHAVDNDRTFQSGTDTASMKFVVNHYFSLLAPEFELTVTDGPGKSQSVDESASGGVLYYDQADGGGFLTFLHVTENEVDVTVD